MKIKKCKCGRKPEYINKKEDYSQIRCACGLKTDKYMWPYMDICISDWNKGVWEKFWDEHIKNK